MICTQSESSETTWASAPGWAMPIIALETDGPSLMLVGEVTFMNAG